MSVHLTQVENQYVEITANVPTGWEHTCVHVVMDSGKQRTELALVIYCTGQFIFFFCHEIFGLKLFTNNY